MINYCYIYFCGIILLSLIDIVYCIFNGRMLLEYIDRLDETTRNIIAVMAWPINIIAIIVWPITILFVFFIIFFYSYYRLRSKKRIKELLK